MDSDPCAGVGAGTGTGAGTKSGSGSSSGADADSFLGSDSLLCSVAVAVVGVAEGAVEGVFGVAVCAVGGDSVGAVGVGVDFLTPIGPLTFSFSQHITKATTDKTETFRFNLGTSF